LLELIVVLAGLGILSSLAIPNYIKYLDYAKVDEAKSLLNSAAADCLQELRRKGEVRLNDEINGDIISTARLKNTGYAFKSGTSPVKDENYLPNCGTVFITAAFEDDRKKRLPDLGFNLTSVGTLTKISVNSGTDTKFAAESWAGKNTTNEGDLTEWQKLNAAIAKAKATCRADRLKFIANPGIGRTKMWDSTKTSQCTTKPPKFEDPATCTADGCTKDVWYIDGEVCGYEPEDFEKCQDAKDDELCKAQKAQMASSNATTKTIDGDKLANCNSPVWFIDGVNQGSAAAWKPLMCERNKKDLLGTTYSGPVEHCDVSPIYILGGKEILPHPASRSDAKDRFDQLLAENKDEQCSIALREDAKTKSTPGPHISPIPEGMEPIIPDDCGAKYWYCSESGKIHRETNEQAKYEADPDCADSCGRPSNSFFCSMYGGDEYCCGG